MDSYNRYRFRLGMKGTIDIAITSERFKPTFTLLYEKSKCPTSANSSERFGGVCGGEA